MYDISDFADPVLEFVEGLVTASPSFTSKWLLN